MLYKAYYDFTYYGLIHTAFQGVVDLVVWLANHNVYEITENMYLQKVGEGQGLICLLFCFSWVEVKKIYFLPYCEGL